MQVIGNYNLGEVDSGVDERRAEKSDILTAIENEKIKLKTELVNIRELKTLLP